MRDIAYGLAAVLSSPLWGWKMLRTGKWRTDWPARFGRVTLTPQDRPTILIHAVSVGEVNAIAQLVPLLDQHLGDAVRLVICTTTDTGLARARLLFEPRHNVVRYPLDFTHSVRRFLRVVQPDVVALVELEVWPTFVGECVARGTRVAVINGRLSARSHGRYRWIRPLVRRAFSSLSVAAVQDEAYAHRFRDMGVEAGRVRVTGTMKWDTATVSDDVPGSQALARAMGVDGGKPLIVCGSTGVGEERAVLDALGGMDAQVMFAPRKPERFDEAARALGDPVRRSASPDGTVRPVGGGRVFLLDTLGELRKAYALSDVAVVGRTFVPQGGSDMIEPIALGKPTIAGPHVENFQGTVDSFLNERGLIQLHEISRLKEAVHSLIRTDEGRAMAERGRGVVLKHQGATKRHAELLEGLLRHENRT